jgi:hypothetical protein
MSVRRIVSGGQTGVDRGALEAALELGIEHGGWCPRGRRAEDERIPDQYRVQENESPDYSARTLRNVRESDATLIVATGKLSGGTRLTRELARRCEKPCLVVRIDGMLSLEHVRGWLADQRVEVLNVAGPRESQSPGIQARTKDFIVRLLGTGSDP